MLHASQETLDEIEREHDNAFLKYISANGEILVDICTKHPYIIFEDVRYDIEPFIEN